MPLEKLPELLSGLRVPDRTLVSPPPDATFVPSGSSGDVRHCRIGVCVGKVVGKSFIVVGAHVHCPAQIRRVGERVHHKHVSSQHIASHQNPFNAQENPAHWPEKIYRRAAAENHG